MITPTTREEWAEAFSDWRRKSGLTLMEICDMIGPHGRDVPRRWCEIGRMPSKPEYRARIRELCGIDLDPLTRIVADERRGVVTRAVNTLDTRGQYDRYGAGGVPVPKAPTQAEIDAGYRALRRTGGYGPHDLTKRLPSKGPRFVPLPRQGSPWTQSALAGFV